LATASFKVHGLLPREPQVVVFIHPEKKLARVQKVAAEDTEPLTVRLEAMGALRGRVLDARGRSWAGLKVRASYRVGEADRARLAGKTFNDLPWARIINREASTDKDGKFHLDGLVPGLEYDLTGNERWRGERIHPASPVQRRRQGQGPRRSQTRNSAPTRAKE
jgi:hypothetical protein